MGRACVLFGVFTLLLFNLNSFGRDIQWFEGTVVFNDNEKLHTELHLNQELGLLMVKEYGNIRTYPSFKFKYVEYFDHQYGEPRFFMSIKNHHRHSNRDNNVFEVVLFGEFYVLRRESPVAQSSTDPFSNSMDRNQYSDMSNFVYYVYDGNRLLKLQNVNKKRMTTLTKVYEQDINQYIRSNHIQFRDSKGKIKVLAYYNALAQCHKDGGDC